MGGEAGKWASRQRSACCTSLARCGRARHLARQAGRCAADRDDRYKSRQKRSERRLTFAYCSNGCCLSSESKSAPESTGAARLLAVHSSTEPTATSTWRLCAQNSRTMLRGSKASLPLKLAASEGLQGFRGRGSTEAGDTHKSRAGQGKRGPHTARAAPGFFRQCCNRAGMQRALGLAFRCKVDTTLCRRPVMAAQGGAQGPKNLLLTGALRPSYLGASLKG